MPGGTGGGAAGAVGFAPAPLIKWVMCVIPTSANSMFFFNLSVAWSLLCFELRMLWHSFLFFRSSSSHPTFSWILSFHGPPIRGL